MPDVLAKKKSDLEALRARGRPVFSLAEILVATKVLTREARAEIEQIMAQHGRTCVACGMTTFLLPGESSTRKPCEHCGGRLKPSGTGRLPSPPQDVRIPSPAPAPRPPEPPRTAPAARRSADEPSDAEAWAAKGAEHGKAGRREEALACFEKALAIEPSHGSAWTGKGACLSQLGRHEEAVRCFAQGERFAKDTLKRASRRFAMTSLQALGRHDEALKLAREALAANAQDASSLLVVVEAELKLGKRAEAIRSLRKLMTMIGAESKLYGRAREIQGLLEVDE